MMTRLSVVVLVVACHPPPEPSYLGPNKLSDGTLPCTEVLAGYDQCVPLVEECMLRCDERSSYYPVQHARDVTNCTAQAGCGPDDHACRDQYCSAQMQACTGPGAVAPQ